MMKGPKFLQVISIIPTLSSNLVLKIDQLLEQISNMNIGKIVVTFHNNYPFYQVNSIFLT